MPGARLRSFRLGDRSELLAEHLLAGFAFTTRVPRQEDIGVDFLCSLIAGDGDGNLLKAGPFFAVQAKSSTEKVVYEKPHELEWITNQENPLLLCVVDRKAAAMDVYSTWNLLCGVLGGDLHGTARPSQITLRPGIVANQWPPIEKPDGTQEILLGEPIVRVSHEDLVREDRTKQIAEVIAGWVALDRMNIVNRQAGIYFVLGPKTYKTGEPLGSDRGVAFYWHPDNLPTCVANLGLSGVSVWRVLNHAQISARTDPTAPLWSEGLQTLEQTLRWCCRLNPSLRAFLPEIES
jgi:hypothetical protein